MAAIGAFTFPVRSTAVDVRTRLVEGRARKLIRVDTILLGSGTLTEFLGDVGVLEGEIERFDRGEATLSITEGRYHEGRRLSVQRTLDEDAKFAAFEILLITEDIHERSTALHEVAKMITASGDRVAVSQAGNTRSRPRMTLTAVGDLVRPSVSDGERTMTFEETLSAGSSLVLDSDLQTAVLAGEENVLAKMSGSFGLLGPGETTITYSDDAASSHSGSLLVAYRDTWV